MSLTDDWKAERLKKEKDYFVKTLCSGKIYPAHLYDDNSFSFCVARGITFGCDTEDVIRITSAVKRFCIAKRESEGEDDNTI